MAGTISHYWTGSVLTVTSDSGTSSADLSGPTGPRGPQGKPGVVYDTDGDIVTGGVVTQDEFDALESRVDNLETNGGGSGESADLSNYYTIQQTNNAITATVTEFLTDYSTTEQMNAAIAQAQLGGDDSSVDLSAYATKSYVDEAVANVSGGGDMTNYYTKSEVDALFAAITDSEEVSY